MHATQATIQKLFFSAISKYHEEAALFLLECGANPNGLNDNSETPIQHLLNSLNIGYMENRKLHIVCACVEFGALVSEQLLLQVHQRWNQADQHQTLALAAQSSGKQQSVFFD